MNAILNYEHYNNEMKKGLSDKLFFMNDKLKKNVFNNNNALDFILDYGCADGSLIKEMSELYPDLGYVGFDIDPIMIKKAQNRHINDAKFYDNFDKAKFRALMYSKRKWAILCSSIIHEVYSYGNNESIQQFWDNLNGGEHDYIIIRDMSVSRDSNFFKELDKNILDKVIQSGCLSQLNDFRNVWGEFKTNKDLVHFLYKYRYLDNWKREVEENYFPVYYEEYEEKIDLNKFELVYKKHYILPFQQQVIKTDFDINLSEPTHVKLIFKRK